MNCKYEIEKATPFRVSYIFFEDLEPVIFVAKDSNGKFFICDLCDDREEKRWIISPVELDDLHYMIYDLKTLRDVFDDSDRIGKSFVLRGRNGAYELKEMAYSEIDELDLPTGGILFESDEEEKKDFLEWFSSEKTHYRKKPVEYSDILKNRNISIYNRFLVGFEGREYNAVGNE